MDFHIHLIDKSLWKEKFFVQFQNDELTGNIFKQFT